MGFLDGLQAKMKKKTNGHPLPPTKNDKDKINLDVSDDGTSILSGSSSEEK